ncbi:MAG: hypothetical protein ABIV11_01660 [Gemmatimonadaceae bacterium]
MDGTLDDAVSSVHLRGRSASTMVVITQAPKRKLSGELLMRLSRAAETLRCKFQVEHGGTHGLA